MLEIIDVVCEKLLQEENLAAKESARLASRALLALKRARPRQAKTPKSHKQEFQPLIVLQKQRRQDVRVNLLIWAFNSLLLFGSTPIGHPQITETGTRCVLLIG